MTKYTTPMRYSSVYLTEDQHRQLTTLAERTDRAFSYLIRAAIDEYLERNEAEKT